MRAINPATGELIREYPEHTEDEVGARLECAGAAFRVWSVRPVAERTALLRALARCCAHWRAGATARGKGVRYLFHPIRRGN